MIPVKFLFIDFAFLIALFIFLHLQNRVKDSESFSSTLPANIGNKSNPISLPTKKELLEFECLARNEGSGIGFDSLVGSWKFFSVWKKGTDSDNFLASSLLRLFSATLQLKKYQTDKDTLKFEIINSIQFGELLLRFVGYGELKGKQPLLPFLFENIELKLGQNILYNRVLKVPDSKSRPFFALIAMGESRDWLAARGKGGGLAL